MKLDQFSYKRLYRRQ